MDRFARRPAGSKDAIEVIFQVAPLRYLVWLTRAGGIPSPSSTGAGRRGFRPGLCPPSLPSPEMEEVLIDEESLLSEWERESEDTRESVSESVEEEGEGPVAEDESGLVDGSPERGASPNPGSLCISAMEGAHRSPRGSEGKNEEMLADRLGSVGLSRGIALTEWLATPKVRQAGRRGLVLGKIRQSIPMAPSSLGCAGSVMIGSGEPWIRSGETKPCLIDDVDMLRSLVRPMARGGSHRKFPFRRGPSTTPWPL